MTYQPAVAHKWTLPGTGRNRSRGSGVLSVSFPRGVIERDPAVRPR